MNQRPVQERPVTSTQPGGDGQPVVPIENELVAALLEVDWSLAVAESLTAGALAARLCTCPGTDDHVLGGVVAYTSGAKRRVLGVSADRVVTPEAAVQMARAVRDVHGADLGVGITGVAGPERQEDQPVGTVFVGWSAPGGDGWEQLACAGTPEQIRREAAAHAMRLLLGVVHRSTTYRD